MDKTKPKPHGTQLPTDDRGHPQPRRTTPEKSVTLQHHRFSRDATRRASPQQAVAPAAAISSPRRNSSGESHDTEPSDAQGWFHRSNRNPGLTTFEPGSMDIDPPFFQKETDSSNEEQREAGGVLQDPTYPYGPEVRHIPHVRPAITQSSSADDYRSVIDDLTVENKRLKEELKRYKQFGPDMMRKEKLFEIKVHGLPKRKKRELEATLRDFAASLEGSSESPSQRNKPGRHGKNMYSSGGSMSKHASSSSSRSRPVDSAYASMSTGPSSHAPNSSKASLNRPSLSSHQTRQSNEQKVQDYLRDTPDGLFPRQLVMTDREKKKLVVRRLEQLFTGKLGGKSVSKTPWAGSASANVVVAPPTIEEEASREAFIQQIDPSRKKTRSRDNVSTSNSGGDRTESGGNGTRTRDGGGSGDRGQSNTSPPTMPVPEQRPTKPTDLDPDRVQIPSENMEYIRHLGLDPSAFVGNDPLREEKVLPDADGWVYLNLLCNLAQLHMINVTPNFIRAAVTEKSAKFQLSPDGRKVRWRGGTDGTKFSSDSSGGDSQKSPTSEDTDISNEDGGSKHPRVKISGGAVASGRSSKKSKTGPHASTSSDSFQYKPMFVRRSSSMEDSLEGTGSQASDGALDDSNDTGNSKWAYSGSGSSPRKKRRHDGAIVYYSGAPFCIDLSGDPGDGSESTYMTSGGREQSEMDGGEAERFTVQRTLSGSSLPFRPLSTAHATVCDYLGIDPDDVGDPMDESADVSEDELWDFPWCSDPEKPKLYPVRDLEACGLGGVLPEDHFVVIVTTRRMLLGSKADLESRSRRSVSIESAEAVVNRLASMSTSSPNPTTNAGAHTSSKTGRPDVVKLEYLAGKLRRLNPSRLPPAATIFPPFSTDSESDSERFDLDSEDDALSSDGGLSREMSSQRVNPHLSESPDVDADDVMLLERDDNLGDGVDDFLSEASDTKHPIRSSVVASAGTARRPELLPTGSSVATAGGAESGYSSSMEDD